MQTIPRRTLSSLILLVALGAIVAPAASGETVAPAWQMATSNGGPANSNEYYVICAALPCNVEAQITNANGRAITSVDWDSDDSAGVLHRDSNTAPDFKASWSYDRPGYHHARVGITFADGTYFGDGATIEVRDPVDNAATVKYAGPDTLAPANDAKNVFQVDYTGRSVSVLITAPGTSLYASPMVGNPWSDANGSHALFRANRGTSGLATIEMTSGYAHENHNVQFVGPAPFRYRWYKPAVQVEKARNGSCVVSVPLRGFSSVGGTSLTSLRLDRKLNNKWRLVRNLSRVATAIDPAYDPRTWTPIRLVLSKRQAADFRYRLRAKLSQTVVSGSKRLFKYGPKTRTVKLDACR
jgi:hypothetical protein